MRRRFEASEYRRGGRETRTRVSARGKRGTNANKFFSVLLETTIFMTNTLTLIVPGGGT